MRFLVDAQLPPALAQLLREHGHVAEHVTDIGPGDLTDQRLWQHAVAHHAVMVTKDEDFSLLSGLHSDGPAVVWIRTGNVRKAALLTWFGPLIDQVMQHICAGQKLIELR